MFSRLVSVSRNTGIRFFATRPREEIQAVVLDIASHFSSSPISLETDFSQFKPKDAVPRPWDDLDTVEMLLTVEESVNHQFPDEFADKFKTPQEVIDYLANVDFPETNSA
eukprot:GDKK01036575.1.p1 GENE.GDKK01036575.1~~GDKK01036575.1.p1  ORF type:complete len:118 (-),score=31.54 GDKK01036575.1:50-379(-)